MIASSSGEASSAKKAALRVLLVGLCVALPGCPQSTTAPPDGGPPPSCRSDRDCSALGLVCDRDVGRCAECVGPADCTDEEVCVGGDCMTRVPCTTSRVCPGLVCDPERGYCVACVDVVDCAPGEACRDGNCVTSPPPACSADSDCAPGQACRDGSCVTPSPACTGDSDCPSGQRCEAGTCEASTCADDSDCPSGQRCDAGTCEASTCTDDSDCPSRQRCDAGTCEASVCSDDSDCSDGEFCNGAEHCASGTPGAPPSGCLDGTPPCASSACDESSDRCTSCDADFDGHDAPGCGGDDCDEGDPLVHPDATEVCDGVDSDCSVGGGTATDEDGDGDGYAAIGSCTGGAIPDTDCDGADPAIHPGAPERCNGMDDDCDGLADDAAGDCGSGEVCFGGRCTTMASGGIVQISAGGAHTCALHASGSVYCWGGQSSYGELGDGVDERSRADTPVSGLTDAVAIAAGGSHTCALRSDGSVVCWGYAGSGQIGDGMMPFSRPMPRAVIGLGGSVSQVIACAQSTCALLTTGEVQCWGDNENGQIGDGTTTNRLSPVYVLGLSGIESLGEGVFDACAVRSDGTFACWGEDEHGEVGDGSPGPDELTPVDGFSGTLVVEEVSDGYAFTCARGAGVSCWGRLPGSLVTTPDATLVPGTSDAVELGVGSDFACIRRTSGSVSCWGMSEFGQLGNGSVGDPATTAPTTPVTGLTDVVQLAVSRAGEFACALRATGDVVCWGHNQHGQLGDGTTMDRSTPVTVLGLPH